MGGLHISWPGPLLEGRLVTRHERFIAEVKLGRRTVLAHCVNPGRMEGMVVPGARVWLTEAADPARKLRFTLQLMELDGVLIGSNTSLPNRLVARALEDPKALGWSQVTTVRAEQPMGRHHRVDFSLEREGQPWLVEVKNCHLVYPDGWGYFPESKSDRAASHARALGRWAARGKRAAIVFTIQRGDGVGVRPSAWHDPAFATALRWAQRQGVEMMGLRFKPELSGLRLDARLPVDVEPYEVGVIEPWARALEASSGWRRTDGRWAGAVAR